MLSHEHAFLERFHAAAEAGFEAVEFPRLYGASVSTVESALRTMSTRWNTVAENPPHACERGASAGVTLLIEPLNVFDPPRTLLTTMAGRHQPGTGEINYAFVLQTLVDAQFGGWCSLECQPRGSTRESLSWMWPYAAAPLQSPVDAHVSRF